MILNQIFATILQTILILLLAPFAVGLTRFLKARFQGRRGPSPFLPYFALATMFRREMVISKSTSWVFRAAPFVVFASSLALALMLPLVFRFGIFGSLGDFLVISGIVMLGSIFLVFGGMDAASAFGGMGSSREMTLAALSETSLILIFATLSFVNKSFQVDNLFGAQSVVAHPYLLLSMFAFVLISLAENARYPVDNPATHLELTMVHEAMTIEYSGRYLALLEYASALKLTAFLILIANFLFPALSSANLSLVGILLALLFTILKVSVLCAVLAFFESVFVKMRFYRMNEYLSLAFFVALFGLIVTLSVIGLNFDYATIWAALAIFFVVFLFGRVRLNSILRYYALSSIAIAGMAYNLALSSEPTEALHLWIFAGITIAIKVILVPLIIRTAERRQKLTANLQSFLRPASSYFLAIILLLVIYCALHRSAVEGIIAWSNMIYVAVVLSVLGLATMIVHRNVFSQIIGLFIVENGIAVFILATVKSLPLLLELGIFAVVALSAVILSILSSQIREQYGSTDTENLRNLTE
ncbi:MAG: NADH-quinone oxidoreductase subunit H [Candidatus Falkowbacteria bacterium]